MPRRRGGRRERRGSTSRYCSIRSPIDGRTGSVMVQAGNIVKANDVARSSTINQIAPIYVSVAVPERELAGDPPPAGAGRAWPSRPSDAADEPAHRERDAHLHRQRRRPHDRARSRSRRRSPNADRALWPGEFVNVRLTLVDRVRRRSSCRTGAVQNGQQGTYVVRREGRRDGRDAARDRRAAAHADGAVIEKGLAAGRAVVTDGQLRLRPGSEGRDPRTARRPPEAKRS